MEYCRQLPNCQLKYAESPDFPICLHFVYLLNGGRVIDQDHNNGSLLSYTLLYAHGQPLVLGCKHSPKSDWYRDYDVLIQTSTRILLDDFATYHRQCRRKGEKTRLEEQEIRAGPALMMVRNSPFRDSQASLPEIPFPP